MTSTLDKTSVQLEDASRRLKVSSATVRNWLRSKLLKSLTDTEIKKLKSKIESGEVAKLRARANKKSAVRRYHFHAELLSKNYTKQEIKILNQWLVANRNSSKEVPAAIFSILAEKSPENLLKQNEYVELMSYWRSDGFELKFKVIKKSLEDLNIKIDESLLVYANQFLSDVADKSTRGAYFTDLDAVNAEINKTISVAGLFCDPCCGAGNFLVAAYARFCRLGIKNAHEYIFGYDIDARAVQITRARLFLMSAGQLRIFEQIKTINTLKEKPNRKFDFICTNPPWGAEIESKAIDTFDSDITGLNTRESFSFFIVKIRKMLKEKASVSLILPESFLNVKAHRRIRDWTFENFEIISVKKSSSKFSGVMSKPIVLTMLVGQTEAGKRDFEIYVEKDIQQKKIINKIEKVGKLLLKDNCDWALGVVTGDNAKFVTELNSNQAAPLITGIDIYKFQILPASRFLQGNFNELQQVAPLEKYRTSEKLVYRFICNELVFAVDRHSHFTLNSANCLIPKLKDITIHALCGILNSELIQFYFTFKFQSLKILRSHIEQLPIVSFDKNNPNWFKIGNLSENLRKSASDQAYNELNDAVFALYGLDQTDRLIVKKALTATRFLLQDKK